MAPFGLMTAGVGLLAKSFTVLCRTTLTRCTSVLPAPYLSMVKCLSTEATGPPKRPINGYLRFVQQQKPFVSKQYPEIKPVDIVRRLAEQWRMLNPEQKRPFEEASVRARAQFKVDLQRYQAQLTPVQLQQQAMEKRQRLDKRKAIRKKRELASLGKPKRPRSSFNIFMSEHFEEARGIGMPAKMKSLMEDWRNLLGHQRQVYTQLAEDDKIRYKNEIKSWEDHMVEMGRDDLLREQTLAARRKASVKEPIKAKKVVKKAKPKAVAAKKASGMSKTAGKTTPSSSAKTVQGRKKA